MTVTPQATYADRAGTLNQNPVELDADGYADVWIDPSLAYKFNLTDADDVQQAGWPIDGVTDPNSAEIPEWNANQTYEQGSIVRDSSGYGLLYVSLADANTSNALTSVGHWRMFDGNVRTITATGAAAVTDNLVRSNSTAGAVTVTLPACSTTPIGKRITVKDVGTGGYTTSVRGAGSDVVDSAVTYPNPLGQYASLTVMNTGSKWDVLNAVDVDDSSIEVGSTGLRVKAAGVTQAMLAARATGTTVAAGGYASSTGSGVYTVVSNSSFNDITNLSVTITTTGRPVALYIIGDSSITAISPNRPGTANGTASNGIALRVIRDASTQVALQYFDVASETSMLLPIGGLIGFDPVAAGTYTYKAQAGTPGQTGAATPGNIAHVKLVAYEI